MPKDTQLVHVSGTRAQSSLPPEPSLCLLPKLLVPPMDLILHVLDPSGLAFLLQLPALRGPVITLLPLTGHCQFNCLSSPPLQGDTGMSQHLAQGLAHGGHAGWMARKLPEVEQLTQGCTESSCEQLDSFPGPGKAGPCQPSSPPVFLELHGNVGSAAFCFHTPGCLL